jgi:plastocyanin
MKNTRIHPHSVRSWCVRARTCAARCAFLVVLIASGAAAAAAGVDLKGTARSGTRPEPNAVIWLDSPDAPASPQEQKVVLHQRSLAFAPHVLAVRVGTTVDFPNEDRVFHNVFSFHESRKFDLGIYPAGSLKRLVFSDPGVSRLYCNMHPNMAGYVVAVDTPYFGAVDGGGAFVIPAVPPGTYSYHAWRPGGPVLTGAVTLRAGSVLDVIWP